MIAPAVPWAAAQPLDLSSAPAKAELLLAVADRFRSLSTDDDQRASRLVFSVRAACRNAGFMTSERELGKRMGYRMSTSPKHSPLTSGPFCVQLMPGLQITQAVLPHSKQTCSQCSPSQLAVMRMAGRPFWTRTPC